MDKRYKARRKAIEKLFRPCERIPQKERSDISPSGKFRLVVNNNSTGKNTWEYSRGIVTDLQTNNTIADIKRNYPHFWHSWVQHPNGNEYLLCREDYQGYTVVNLTKEVTHVHFPEEGYKGFGFCWRKVWPSPDALMLAVNGCYWAHPDELVFYDFRTPDVLPLSEIRRVNSLGKAQGWKDNKTFVLTREVEFRKSDGAPYESLSEEEQDRLDSDESLTDYRIERLEVTRPVLKDDNANKTSGGNVQ